MANVALLTRLLAPSPGQVEAARVGVGSGATGLQHAEPWELEMVKAQRVNPSFYSALLRFWMSAAAMPLDQVVANAAALLASAPDNPGRARWLAGSGLPLPDPGTVEQTVEFMRGQVSASGLPRQLSRLLGEASISKALEKELALSVLTRRGRGYEAAYEQYEDSPYLAAFEAVPLDVLAPDWDVVSRATRLVPAAPGAAPRAPVAPMAPTPGVLLAAVQSLRRRGLHRSLPFAPSLRIEASDQLWLGSHRAALGEKQQSAAALRKKEAADLGAVRRLNPRTKALQRAMFLQAQLAGVKVRAKRVQSHCVSRCVNARHRHEIIAFANAKRSRESWNTRARRERLASSGRAARRTGSWTSRGSASRTR